MSIRGKGIDWHGMAGPDCRILGRAYIEGGGIMNLTLNHMRNCICVCLIVLPCSSNLLNVIGGLSAIAPTLHSPPRR